MNRRTATEPRDDTYEGEPALFVPLQDGTWAVTTREGYERVLAAGLPGVWNGQFDKKSGHRYVCTDVPKLGKKVAHRKSIAAVIAGADRDTQAHYANGNRQDLRPSNLTLQPRRGRRGPVQPMEVDW